MHKSLWLQLEYKSSKSPNIHGKATEILLLLRIYDEILCAMNLATRQFLLIAQSFQLIQLLRWWYMRRTSNLCQSKFKFSVWKCLWNQMKRNEMNSSRIQKNNANADYDGNDDAACIQTPLIPPNPCFIIQNCNGKQYPLPTAHYIRHNTYKPIATYSLSKTTEFQPQFLIKIANVLAACLLKINGET